MRVALLNSGFYVANGEGTGSKKETIVALSPGFPTPCPYPLVGQEWLERWRRSSKKFPDGLTPEQQELVQGLRKDNQRMLKILSELLNNGMLTL